MMNNIKTGILMALLAGIFMAMGSLIGGQQGLTFAFCLALLLNGIMYFFSDKIVLALYHAKPLDIKTHPEIYQIVHELCGKLSIPAPKLWLIETPVANAFATGRNPHHSSVAFTTGILQILERHELRGVIAHELSHIVNRDIFVTTLAATFAAAIGYLANFSRHALIWGGYPSDRNNKSNSLGIIATIATIILMPIIATLVRLGISRSREYLADETGAHTCHDPLALASALKKLAAHTRHASFSQDDATKTATAGLFIVRPFSGDTFLDLLSTHPPLSKRVAALEQMHLNNHRWDL